MVIVHLVCSSNLLSQQRIRVHINLFISLLLYEVSFMIYELTVRNPILVEHVVSTNSVSNLLRIHKDSSNSIVQGTILLQES